MDTPNMSEGLLINQRYRLIRKLGAGGMGEVWEACIQNVPEQRLAIKFLYAHDQQSEQFERFTREAKILDRLSHPNITTIYDFMLKHQPPYIVLEYLQGEPLSERLAKVKRNQQTGLAIAEVVAIVSQVRNALEKTHQEGVIHRDLKPENIYLCDQGSGAPPLVKVLDFGVSKMYGEQQITQHQQGFLGTPQYMSPEQALGQENVDSRADQFSLAIIIYEMLSGELPFKGEQIIQIATQIVHGDPPYIRELVPLLPSFAAQALHRALCKSPDDRYPSCKAFIDDFVYGAQQEQEQDEWALDAQTEVGVRHSIIQGGSPIGDSLAATVQEFNEERDTHRTLPALSSSEDPTSQLAHSDNLNFEGPATVQVAYNPALFENSGEYRASSLESSQENMRIPQRQLQPPKIKLQAQQKSDPNLFPTAPPPQTAPRQAKVQDNSKNLFAYILVGILAMVVAMISMGNNELSLKDRAQSLNTSPVLKTGFILPQFKKEISDIALVQNFNSKQRRRLKKTRRLPRSETRLSTGQLNLLLQINRLSPTAKGLITTATVHWYGPQEQHRVQALSPLPKPLQRYGYWQAKLKFNNGMTGRWVALITSGKQVVAEFPFEVRP